MSFRLVPKSVTLNDIMAVILRYFNKFDSFRCALHKSSRSLSHLLMSPCSFFSGRVHPQGTDRVTDTSYGRHA